MLVGVRIIDDPIVDAMRDFEEEARASAWRSLELMMFRMNKERRRALEREAAVHGEYGWLRCM